MFIKDLLGELYSYAVFLLTSIFKLFPTKKKVTYVSSFGDNYFYLYKEANEKFSEYEHVLVVKPRVKKDYDERGIKYHLFETKNLKDWIVSFYHITTSEYVIVDNYFAFLSGMNFKKGTECVQIWHAAGAVKKFGLESSENKERSAIAKRRFRKVYSKFHKIVIGSENMKEVYKGAFEVEGDRFLKTGIPRTDLFFNEDEIKYYQQVLYKKYPILKEKKVLLYAPTFRSGKLDDQKIPLDIELMHKWLKDRYVLAVKLHPSVQHIHTPSNDFIMDLSTENINHLLLVTDMLITDYSSLPFEFALRNKPMIFYPYDFEQYSEDIGFCFDYHEEVPGPVVKSTEELLVKIHELEDNVNLSNIKSFSDAWNEYSTGDASKKLISYMKDEPYEMKGIYDEKVSAKN
ncbi:CDP-glycerol glycerophosphotransferase family protein [Bacillus shivajii]|uniref:CDP-glycerol glycerophosphotransferase family protein n=1 Tax=Bacillus shivajii TaxID=1983719 RepID=UPI001CF98AD2|nr:CDP-glycerol glycerophosphotransferase family protein [Bacillus shivajii]UCZ52716.1 CDP-glycerol glycerophosphotransferase family protein [Bacillus shivajii]